MGNRLACVLDHMISMTGRNDRAGHKSLNRTANTTWLIVFACYAGILDNALSNATSLLTALQNSVLNDTSGQLTQLVQTTLTTTNTLLTQLQTSIVTNTTNQLTGVASILVTNTVNNVTNLLNQLSQSTLDNASASLQVRTDDFFRLLKEQLVKIIFSCCLKLIRILAHLSSPNLAPFIIQSILLISPIQARLVFASLS